MTTIKAVPLVATKVKSTSKAKTRVRPNEVGQTRNVTSIFDRSDKSEKDKMSEISE